MENIRAKIFAVMLALTLLFAGIACTGGGGGETPITWPELPEGTLYLYEEGMPEQLGGEYQQVTPFLDYSYVPLPANPDKSIWAHGLFLWMNCYDEDGFILTIVPDDPEEDVVRLSIAFNTRGINFGQKTLDFMAEDPANLFIVLGIMDRLEGAAGGGVLATGVIDSDVYITARGYYQREMKEGAQDIVDSYYSQMPTLLRLLISEEQFKAYISQLLYKSTYVDGERLGIPGVSGGFTELLAIFLEPWNWPRTDFKTTIDLEVPIAVISNVDSLSEGTYRLGSMEEGGRIYNRGAGDYFLAEFPSELIGRQIIRTRLDDREWSIDDEDFLTFSLTRTSDLYIAVDPGNTALISWLTNEGWLDCGEEILIDTPGDPFSFDLYCYPDHTQGPVSLPGNGGGDETMMYFVMADAGTFPFELDVIMSAHANLMQDNPADAARYLPDIKEEGGIVVNSEVPGGAWINGEQVDLYYTSFVSEFDANVLINTGEAGKQTAVADVTDIQFVEHILKNNGFRLIDTYNDKYPAFGADSQVMRVESMLGFTMDPPVEVELSRDTLYVFTNMNLLNSPNLVGVYIKSLVTDSTAFTIWEDEQGGNLNVWGIRNYLRDNALNYRYFLARNNTEVTLVELLQRIGKSEEGELTFRVIVELPGNTTFEMVGGAFNQDYFTNVYDVALQATGPMPVPLEMLEIFTAEIAE